MQVSFKTAIEYTKQNPYVFDATGPFAFVLQYTRDSAKRSAHKTFCVVPICVRQRLRRVLLFPSFSHFYKLTASLSPAAGI
jgi:hypothetical protein